MASTDEIRFLVRVIKRCAKMLVALLEKWEKGEIIKNGIRHIILVSPNRIPE